MSNEPEFQRRVLTSLGVIESRLDALETQLTIIQHDQTAQQTSVYWVLAAIGIFIAAIALRPFHRESKSEPPVSPITIQFPSSILSVPNQPQKDV